jgi:hypothetical protein
MIRETCLRTPALLMYWTFVGIVANGSWYWALALCSDRLARHSTQYLFDLDE